MVPWRAENHPDAARAAPEWGPVSEHQANLARTTDKLLSAVLVALCICTIALSVRYIREQDRWSPVDEYAHFDYVQKLLQGRLPRLSDSISEELFQHIRTDPARSVIGISQPGRRLGLANHSYQAKHPPLYFVVLAVPEWIMQTMDRPIFARLEVLRLFSYSLYVAGMLLCIPVVRALNRSGSTIPGFYAWGAVWFGLLVFSHGRYGLGNNVLSPLLINAAVLCLVRYQARPQDRDLYGFVTLCGLSILAALTNVFIVPVLCAFILGTYARNRSWRNLVVSASLAAAAAALLFAWKRFSVPDPGFERSLQHWLLTTIPSGALGYDQVVKVLLADAFTIDFVSDRLVITRGVAASFLISTCYCLLHARSIVRNHAWIVCALALFAALVLVTFLANRYVPRVHWMLFRHYLGFVPFVYVACTAFVPVAYARWLAREGPRGLAGDPLALAR
jgi:hypothetical protein